MKHFSAIKLGFLSVFSYIIFSLPVDAAAQKKVVAQPKPKTTVSKSKSTKQIKTVKFLPPKIDIENDVANPPIQDEIMLEGKNVVEASDYASPRPTDFVNPMVGTGGHGHTFPGAVWPFGMVQLSPDTRTDASWDGCGGYYYDDTFIYGFSHTHLSGTGVSDYGDVLFQPIMGASSFSPLKYRSKFSHSQEIAEPGYYSNYLNDNLVKVELSALPRVGIHRYTFSVNEIKANDSIFVVIDLKHRDYLLGHQLEVLADGHTVKGFRRSKAWANDQSVFFYSYFQEKILSVQFNQDKSVAILFFGRMSDMQTPQFRIHSAVGISFTSLEGAELNIRKQVLTKLSSDNERLLVDVTSAQRLAQEAWNKELSKIDVLGSSSSLSYKRADFFKFYTALYHCMIHPSLASDEDGKYRGRDQKIHQGTRNYFSVFSLWDTYRALHPLLTLIDRGRTSDFVNTFLLQYVQGGRLPVWELGSCETDCMIGYHSVSVIADALMKDIENIDIDLAIEAMRHSSDRKEESLGMKVNEQGTLKKSIFKNDYIDVKSESESVSKSLEYAYNDWCIAQVIQKYKLNSNKVASDSWTSIYNEYMRRSNRWQHYLDPKTKFMRPKVNGEWISPFEPREVNNHFTEANSFQYSFYVPHQINLWKNYLGGDEALERQLDTLFGTISKTTGREQSDISGLIGQYAHGNEPSHHMAYLYNYCNKPEKTQRLVRKIWREFYKNTPDGLIGNEDCGQMSAWAVMSALGFYPVTPGSNEFAVGVPFFEEIEMKIQNSSHLRPLDINVRPRLYSNTVYELKNAGLANANDQKTRLFLKYQDLYNGVLKFDLNKRLDTLKFAGSDVESGRKYSEIAPTIVGNRIFTENKHTISVVPSDFSFVNQTDKVSLQLEIKYAGLDKPMTQQKELAKGEVWNVVIHGNCEVAASTKWNQNWSSSVAIFTKKENQYKVVSISGAYNKQYSGGGDDALVNGILGSEEWRSGDWQGYQNQDFEAVIDLGQNTELNSIGARFLQDTRAWILMPTEVEYFVSNNGKDFKSVAKVGHFFPDTILNTTVVPLNLLIKKQKARFIKVKAKNYGALPPWHQGYPFGGTAFIFIDEILVNPEIIVEIQSK